MAPTAPLIVEGEVTGGDAPTATSLGPPLDAPIASKVTEGDGPLLYPVSPRDVVVAPTGMGGPAPPSTPKPHVRAGPTP